MELKRQFGLFTCVLIVIADMIGTGIFMTTGNVLGMTGNALAVLALWAVGGLVAITGSLCYAELSSMWPDVGGEYVYLKNIYGYLPAFLSGWISLVVGFSAPVATGSILTVEYLNRFLHNTLPPESPFYSLLESLWVQKSLAAGIILLFGLIHIAGVKGSSHFQNFLTFLKILIITLMIGFGLFLADWSQISRLTADYTIPGKASPMSIPVLGLALLIVMFAYSGWNSATYIAGEIKNPEKNLLRALLIGTLVTTLLYLFLNTVFLMSAPGKELMGKDEVGAIATCSLFGSEACGFFTLCIAIILLSAISVQMMVGPRIYYAMARDNMIFASLARVHPRFRTPALSISIQILLSVFYVFSGSAMTLVIYMGFALNVFPIMAVIGLVYMRYKHPHLDRPYRVHFYPYVPAIYIILSLAMMTAALLNWTKTSLFAIGVIAVGVPVFYLWQRFAGKQN